MEIRGSTLILVVAAAGAAVYAAYDAGQSRPSSSAPVAAAAQQQPQPEQGSMNAPPLEDTNQPLPPNHPPIDPMNGMNGGNGLNGVQPDDEPAAIQWKPAGAWQVAPNPNAMRIATYEVAAAKGDRDGAEISVSRAGGGVDANIERWVGQFGAQARETRAKEKVAGFDVTFVEVTGTYSGGMSASDPTARTGWALRGAIVDTPGTAYFFKMIGPAATVTAARPAFDAMIKGITKSAS